MNNLNKILNFIFFIMVLMIVLKVFIFILPAILILVAVLLLMNWKMIKQLSEMFGKKQEFKTVPGKTYKECRYCQKKADRHAPACAFCGKAFE
jgi:hypothetical protein